LPTEIQMPRLSLTMKTGSVIQWLKKEGEPVKKGEPIVEVLSEKVTCDIEAPADGVLRRILAEEGMEIPVGQPLAIIGNPDEEIPNEPPYLTKSEPIIMEQAADTSQRSKETVRASPAARRLVKEQNLDLTEILGTGPDGRIIEDDVKRHIAQMTQTGPQVKQVIPLEGIRKVTAERVASSFRTAPHSYLMMDVDVTKALKIKEESGFSYTAIIVHSVARALREHLQVNSALIRDAVQVYEEVNVGVAMSTDRGLLVPVIRNADEKSLNEVSQELEALIKKTREDRLSRDDLVAGTFTVTNLGMFDVDMFLPIINPPEAAILAAGRIVQKPIYVKEEFIAKPVMTLTLAYDHRIIDGAPAATFLKRIKENIENLQ
jgi:pyruvate dehydrogenase E2 component (dihydrolipoamide acetyltransferase)